MQKLTPAEWSNLAQSARGFGPDGRMTLADYIDWRVELAEARMANALIHERLDRTMARICDRIDDHVARIREG